MFRRLRGLNSTNPLKFSAFGHIKQFEETGGELGAISFIKYRERIMKNYAAATKEEQVKLYPFYKAVNWQDVVKVFQQLDSVDYVFFHDMEIFISETIEETYSTLVKRDLFILSMIPAGIAGITGIMIFIISR